ncbi:hypothetical protein [Methanonatronarchaeum sp. AMET-Sl]|uniref:hypothetical protein n=1 Tax=Methanonatronarchaeum sp. AMET-Sl TaxID=3037654 RepID=UPI00244DC0BF|nr:hypothetical protein [Methanonatronarchaeum sp. AMET-Sl]WGI17890.1 hypothetical protein QEN48_02470 [Methanonatronarchaeum sp. AMET-Sl]
MNSVADSSFYIFFYSDIEGKKYLHKLIRSYDFVIGPKIKNEIKQEVYGDEVFFDKTKYFESEVNLASGLKIFYNFLIENFDEVDGEDIKDAEYEAIGVSYVLKEANELKYLILDDNEAYKFVDKNFDQIKSNLVRTFRFICLTKTDTNKLNEKLIYDVCKATKNSINNGNHPLNINKEKWKNEIYPLFKETLRGEN